MLQGAFNILSLRPMDYHMKNIWNSTTTNEELNMKFKCMIGDYL